MELCDCQLFEFGFDKDTVDTICSIVTYLLNKCYKKCYEVRAKYIKAKMKKGVQGAVYRHAEEHRAYYSLERSKSIFYNDDDDDLQIILLFREERSADLFRTFLSQWYLNNPLVVRYGDVVVEEDVKVLYIHYPSMERVELAHYTATESDSPIQTLEELHRVPTSDSHVSALSFGTPIAQFQCLERPEIFTHRQPVQCHIKPRKDFKRLVSNDNNQLGLSREFHDFFDGTITIDQKSGKNNVPLFAIKPPERGDFKEEVIGSPPLKRKRVEVVIECRDDTVGDKVSKHLKMGSKKMSGTQFKTFVHVEDAKMFCDCLEWKYKDTCKRWEEADTWMDA